MRIELSAISKSFFSKGLPVEIFRDLNLTIAPGEFVVILGPNGCGKTTLLNLISGLDQSYTGVIGITGDRRKNDFSYMMQKDLLLPWRTVYGNTVIGLEIQGMAADLRERAAISYLDEFGLKSLRTAYPPGLSGGERQKVALARTLLMDSQTLLLDEPFSAIDYQNRIELQEKIVRWVKGSGRTAIMVTHDIDEAIAVADRIIILGPRPKGIKDNFKVDLGPGIRTNLQTRQHPDFAGYYTRIWNAASTNLFNEV